MHPQQPPQQYAPPQQQWGPPPGPPMPPTPHRRKSSPAKVVALIAGALFVGAVTIGVLLGGVGDGQAPVPGVSASQSTAAEPSAGAVPTPDAGERRAYLAALTAIGPGLAVNDERALRRAGRICERIINPPEGGKLTLREYVVEELSGGNATINEQQAGKVIAAVKVWCR